MKSAILIMMMDDLRVYVFFNSITVISGRWKGDFESLHARKPLLRLKRFASPGIELRTARSARNPLKCSYHVEMITISKS